MTTDTFDPLCLPHVAALLRAIDEGDDSALPILADALEEVGDGSVSEMWAGRCVNSPGPGPVPKEDRSMIHRSDLAAIAATEQMAEYRNCRHPAQFRPRHARRRGPGSWDRRGCESLVAKAAGEYLAATGHALSWNFERHGPWVEASHGRTYHDAAERERMLSTAARTAGFLRALGQHPEKYALAIRLLQAGDHGRGMNSLSTVIDLYAVTARFSPGGLCTWLRKVIRRADQVLRGYGLRVSWDALCRVASRGDKRVGKAALRAAAHTCKLFALWWVNCRVVSADPDRDPVGVLIQARGLAQIVCRPVMVSRYTGDRRFRHRNVDDYPWWISSISEVLQWERFQPEIARRSAVLGILEEKVWQAWQQVPGLLEAAAQERPALNEDEAQAALLQLRDWLEDHAHA